ncbi:MAG: esterase-like activity of phytase family protein [Chitinophagaceae bacterium]
MRTLFFLLAILSCSSLFAQPPSPQSYSLDKIELPAQFTKQVCISGMKYYDKFLYMASERCPSIFVVDPETASIIKTITIQVPQNYEMEGMTSYRDKLYLVSENIAAVYEVNMQTGAIMQLPTSLLLPPKSKDGDGMEGIAANEKDDKFYLLRERNDNMSASQIYTFSIVQGKNKEPMSLKYESMIELPLENPQWRYSDICYDRVNSRLICLKSYAKGKFRQQYLESVDISKTGNLQLETLKNIEVENFTAASNAYKTQKYSMNLEGVTVDDAGTIYIISDNTSGKAECDLDSKEKTVLLQLKKK